MINAEIRGDRIAVFGNTYKHKDVLKMFVGARWDKNLRAWTYPAHIDSLDALKAYFHDGLNVDDSCSFLEDQRDRIKAAVAAKTGEATGPSMVKTEPWDHQSRAFDFVTALIGPTGGGAMLALDMGTGKTKVAIDFINSISADKILVVCPKSVVSVWPLEFMRHSFFDFKIMTANIKGTVEQKRRKFQTESWDVLVLNKDIVWRSEVADYLLSVNWDIVVYDESHHIKTPGSNISKFMYKLGKRVRYRLALTGTPMPQSPLDLYGQFRFINDGVFGTSFVKFRSRYAIMGGFENRQVIDYQREDEMRRKFEENAFVVKSDDVLDLPDTMTVQRTCKLSSAERRVYKDMADELVAELDDGVITAANAMVKVVRLAQIANGVCEGVRIGHSKENLLEEVLDELPREEPAVVFCRFHADMDSVRAVCERSGRPYFELSGRRDDLGAWDKGVIAVQYQAGAAGVDLTLAGYCIFFAPVYSLGDYQQAKKRIHRPRQKKTVVYIQLIAEGTIDRRIYKALDSKKDVIDSIFEEGLYAEGSEDDSTQAEEKEA